MRKKILVSDAVYVLFQPCLVYFAFGDGRSRIPPQARFVLMALVGLMMMVNLYFCEENCFQKIKKEEAKENGNTWVDVYKRQQMGMAEWLPGQTVKL